MRNFSLVALMLVGMLTLSACQTNSPMDLATQTGTPVAVQKVITGDDAGMTTPAVLLVTSKEQLKALGSKELINQSVDFTKNALVVVALGQRPTGGYWVKITGVTQKGSWLIAQGVANKPGPMDATTQAITHPYAAAVVAKTSATHASEELSAVVGQSAK